MSAGYSAARLASVQVDYWAVPSGAIRVATMVASMAEHWVAVMVVQKDATKAVCSADERDVPLVVAKVAQTVGH